MKVHYPFHPLRQQSLEVLAWPRQANLSVTVRHPDGSTLKPVESSIKELGARLEVLQRRVTITGGYYELINFNTLNADPLRPGFRIETGKQRTRGIEFDFVGRLLPGWQIIGSANFTKGIVTRDLVNPAHSERTG